ncbi:hypothetical protein J5Y09_18260 [Roseomonas sp. PWR1]|uniref:Uncharacterized protein n=1 Tax=Roseomonas nitratireducens TaxID=2820810 RepID=A0ABS4AX02_9PROT|nr:hypothetical protein [Neoroseomonas nitratireducens]MBP0465876.1 hypothetical protein [Neoroseomonas nitratireducens]
MAIGELQLEGRTVLQWLTRASEDEWGALIDCLVDDGDREEAWLIVNVRRNLLEVTTEGTPAARVRRQWTWLSSGFVIIPEARREVVDLVERSRPPEVVAFEAAQARLRNLGFDPHRFATSDDVFLVDRVLAEAATDRVVPRRADRFAFYEALKSCGQFRPAIPHLRAWMAAVEADQEPLVDASERLRLSVMLRHAGQPGASLDVSAVVDLPPTLLRAEDEVVAMLCTHRAAALLDLFDSTGDCDLLTDARRYLDRAWRLKKGPEASNTYQRWHRLKERCKPARTSLGLRREDH